MVSGFVTFQPFMVANVPSANGHFLSSLPTCGNRHSQSSAGNHLHTFLFCHSYLDVLMWYSDTFTDVVRFRPPFWNFEILNIFISFRMPKNIWIDTKIVQIGHFYIFYRFSHGGRRPSWILGFWRKCSRVPVWHSSDLDSAPQNLLETATKITRYKKARFR